MTEHEKRMNRLNILLSIVFMLMVYILGIKFINAYSKNSVPIYACGIVEACRAHDGTLGQTETEKVMTYTCQFEKR